MAEIGAVACADLSFWISRIPFEEWPQQSKLNGQIRPAMVTDLGWHKFGEVAWPVVHDLGFDESHVQQLMLSAVMPGHAIEPHRDEQPAPWLYRVHVPLISNPKAVFIAEGKEWAMQPGIAYRVDTRIEHAVANRGEIPRVHFMFDVLEG